LMQKVMNSMNVNIEKYRPQKSQLKFISDNIYLLPGEIYSTTPELSSAKYFHVKDSIYPVFDQNQYKESIRNLFLNLLTSKTILNITQKMYGGSDEKFKININHFYANFSKDFNIYFGWQNDDRENLKASIFLSHKIYNYNHLFVITTNTKSIFKKNSEINGILLTYIPREKPIDLNPK